MCLVCDAGDRKINPHILKGCSPLGSPERNILIYEQYRSSIDACFVPARLARNALLYPHRYPVPSVLWSSCILWM